MYSTLKDAEFYEIEANCFFELPFRDSKNQLASIS